MTGREKPSQVALGLDFPEQALDIRHLHGTAGKIGDAVLFQLLDGTGHGFRADADHGRQILPRQATIRANELRAAGHVEEYDLWMSKFSEVKSLLDEGPKKR
jgi:hypothetical protein